MTVTPSTFNRYSYQRTMRHLVTEYGVMNVRIIIPLFRQRAENTKFKDRQAGEHIILLVHNKHRLLKLRNTKRSTLQLTK